MRYEETKGVDESNNYRLTLLYRHALSPNREVIDNGKVRCSLSDQSDTSMNGMSFARGRDFSTSLSSMTKTSIDVASWLSS